MRAFSIVTLFTVAAVAIPAFAEHPAKRVVEPPAKVKVTKAVAKRTVSPKVDMKTVLRCDQGTCVKVSTKTTAGSKLERKDERP